MSNVIAFPSRNEVGEQYIQRDDYGRSVGFAFTATYTLNGRQYAIFFTAKDHDDAERHIQAMIDSLNLEGQMIMEISDV